MAGAAVVKIVVDLASAGRTTRASVKLLVSVVNAAARSDGDLSAFESMQLMIAEPTMTPSAKPDTSATCAGVDMPNPTARGTLEFLRILLMNSFKSAGRDPLAPVTPF